VTLSCSFSNSLIDVTWNLMWVRTWRCYLDGSQDLWLCNYSVITTLTLCSHTEISILTFEFSHVVTVTFCFRMFTAYTIPSVHYFYHAWSSYVLSSGSYHTFPVWPLCDPAPSIWPPHLNLNYHGKATATFHLVCLTNTDWALGGCQPQDQASWHRPWVHQWPAACTSAVQ